MYEDGLLGRFSIVINSDFQRESQLPSGNYYYISENHNSLIKEVDWDEVKERIQLFKRKTLDAGREIKRLTKKDLMSILSQELNIPHISGFMDLWI